jgi:hypothetical protein
VLKIIIVYSFEIKELHMGFGGVNSGIASASDVALNNPIVGQGLVYDNSTSKWINQPVYAKPASGIPLADLTADTQTKLNATSTVLVLEATQAIPTGTPEGTLIFRKSS